MAEQQKMPNGKPTWQKLAPLFVIVCLIIAFFATGLHTKISFDAIALQYGVITAWVAAHPISAVLLTITLYALAIAVSFPITWLLSVTVALIFGWALGTIMVVIGATIGASMLYFAARWALADFFRARAGNVLNRMAEGFRKDAVSYMLFLRLAPVFPFALINVVPAILGVPFRIFALTTFVGIIPGALAFSFAGEGLRSIVAERAQACAINSAPCGEPLTPGDIITPQILIALAMLAIISLLPVLLKWVQRLRR